MMYKLDQIASNAPHWWHIAYGQLMDQTNRSQGVVLLPVNVLLSVCVYQFSIRMLHNTNQFRTTQEETTYPCYIQGAPFRISL